MGEPMDDETEGTKRGTSPKDLTNSPQVSASWLEHLERSKQRAAQRRSRGEHLQPLTPEEKDLCRKKFGMVFKGDPGYKEPHPSRARTLHKALGGRSWKFWAGTGDKGYLVSHPARLLWGWCFGLPLPSIVL